MGGREKIYRDGKRNNTEKENKDPLIGGGGGRTLHFLKKKWASETTE